MRLFKSAPTPMRVGLDIGTTKVAVVIAEAQTDAEPRILAASSVPHAGLARGEVIHFGHAVDAVQEAVHKAEQAAGLTIHSAYVSLAGAHVRAHVQPGAVIVSRADREIGFEDRERVLDMARQALRPSIGEIIHEIPLGFSVDGVGGVDDPVGLSGYHLSTDVLFATGSEAAINNVYRCAQKAGIDVEGLVLDPLASAYAVLTEEERNAGVLLIDIGGGTSDIAIFLEDKLCYTGVVGLGGKNVTRDLSIGLQITPTQAEQMKKSFGPDSWESEMVGEIAGARMEEIFYAVHDKIRSIKEAQLLGAGIVLTGGGSLLYRTDYWAESILHMPAICKQPSHLNGLSSSPGATMATSIGLVQYAAVHDEQHHTYKTSIYERIKRYLREFV